MFIFMLRENENGQRLDMETDMDTDMTGHKHSKNQVSDVRPGIDLKNMIPYRTCEITDYLWTPIRNPPFCLYCHWESRAIL